MMTFPKKLHAFLLAVCILFTSMVFAVEPLPENLLQFDSVQGSALLKKSGHLNTSHLLAHFTTQDTQTYCGVATAIMVLNSTIVQDAPIDPVYNPYAYFTQDNFFTDAVKEIITPRRSACGGDDITRNG